MNATLRMGTHSLNAEITVDGGLEGGTVLIRPVSKGHGEDFVYEFSMAMKTHSLRLDGVPFEVCEAVYRGSVAVEAA